MGKKETQKKEQNLKQENVEHWIQEEEEEAAYYQCLGGKKFCCFNIVLIRHRIACLFLTELSEGKKKEKKRTNLE